MTVTFFSSAVRLCNAWNAVRSIPFPLIFRWNGKAVSRTAFSGQRHIRDIQRHKDKRSDGIDLKSSTTLSTNFSCLSGFMSVMRATTPNMRRLPFRFYVGDARDDAEYAAFAERDDHH